MNRREFSLLLAAAGVARGQLGRRPVLYAAVGPELAWYGVDVAGGELVRRGAVTLPANVQYCWPHVSKQFLYVASSDGVPGATTPVARGVHHLSAFRIDAASGALSKHGEAVALPARPIHMTTDARSEFVLVAFNNPSAVRVFGVNRDGSLGAEVAQANPIDAGIYAHQVRVSSDNRLAILVTRGNDAAGGKAEDPGALKVFRFERGQLTREVSIAPGGGFGFGPRHLDFHPSKPWVFVSLERQNKMFVYRRSGDALEPRAVFEADTLEKPSAFPQAAGAVHVHPNGRFVYGVNRADTAVDSGGRKVFAGGENSLVVYSVDAGSGALKAVQHVDTRGIHCRTFAIDPSGRMLVAAHIAPMVVGESVVVAGMSVFRIGGDGRLTFVRKHEVDGGGKNLFWVGMV